MLDHFPLEITDKILLGFTDKEKLQLRLVNSHWNDLIKYRYNERHIRINTRFATTSSSTALNWLDYHQLYKLKKFVEINNTYTNKKINYTSTGPFSLVWDRMPKLTSIRIGLQILSNENIVNQLNNLRQIIFSGSATNETCWLWFPIELVKNFQFEIGKIYVFNIGSVYIENEQILNLELPLISNKINVNAANSDRSFDCLFFEFSKDINCQSKNNPNDEWLWYSFDELNLGKYVNHRTDNMSIDYFYRYPHPQSSTRGKCSDIDINANNNIQRPKKVC
ncbi:F-box protein SCDLUD_004127 [Saccharomycodes ludwigii]|uniref:F-box protein n=1 Tax=Saccharomycodes ludwigii TaxID=36035 RepID=UPI001E834F9A|nr:hypothetical protein SCDLUD_004127 [Saccharomycodes ludwigii]KAH3899832.1 hypothetical protein SCDLUD_004127 [Saccharomycodes ludwigii]